MPLQQHRCFHNFTPLFTVKLIRSVPGRPQAQILLFEVILDSAQPCLTRTTTRSLPFLWQVISASIDGACMVLIRVRTDDVTEEPQTPEHDYLGDRRFSRAEADILVGDVSSEWDWVRIGIDYSHKLHSTSHIIIVMSDHILMTTCKLLFKFMIAH